MAAFFGIFLALFVFTMTVSGISVAVGPVGGPQYDILASAQLLQQNYLKVFGVPEAALVPASYVLMALPAVLSFFVVQAIFGSRNQ